MNVFKRIANKFTARGRALAQIGRGMDYANKNDTDSAIQHYTDVVNSAETPRDVQAMALFNRALMYTTMGMESEAIKDLKTILSMPETMAKIKKAASEKLVRMQRKLEREKRPSRCPTQHHHGLRQDDKYTNR